MKGHYGSGSDVFCFLPHGKVTETQTRVLPLRGFLQQDYSLHCNQLPLQAQQTLAKANVSCIYGYLMK